MHPVSFLVLTSGEKVEESGWGEKGKDKRHREPLPSSQGPGGGQSCQPGSLAASRSSPLSLLLWLSRNREGGGGGSIGFSHAASMGADFEEKTKSGKSAMLGGNVPPDRAFVRGCFFRQKRGNSPGPCFFPFLPEWPRPPVKPQYIRGVGWRLRVFPFTF